MLSRIKGNFLWCKALSAQLDTEFTEPHYDQLKKVYSIWLCFESSKEQANAIAEYAIQEKKKQLSEKYGMYMERKLGKELESMCNMSGYILERGIEQGLERGIEQGMERGIEQGMERGIEQGMERGIEQGMERGIAEGEARFGKLIQKMIADGRSNEIPQVASDQNIRKQLYKEYHL